MNRTGVNVPPGAQVMYSQTVSTGGYPGYVVASPGQYGKFNHSLFSVVFSLCQCGKWKALIFL